MGLDYSYDLYFTRNKLWDVLEDLALIQSPSPYFGQTKVVLPDRTILLPFGSYLKSKSLVWDESISRLEFETCLFFPLDNRIAAYMNEDQKDYDAESQTPPYPRPHAVNGCYDIGTIYLSINLDFSKRGVSYEPRSFKFRPDAILFNFTAATTRMSRLFSRSDSIRRTFVDLSEMHDGICVYFDDESEDGPILWPKPVEFDRATAFRKFLQA